jgi:AraC-like DNA-binding protein
MKLYVKFMVSQECKKNVQQTLERMGLDYQGMDLCEVEVKNNITDLQRSRLKEELLVSGYELMDGKSSSIIQDIKDSITELIHYSDELPKIKNSDFLADKLKHDYTYMANLFSEATGITIEQYIITQKIERVKRLLMFEKLTLTEISYKLNYCSVAHLSQQFKKVTGLTPSFFKQLKIAT